MTWAWPSGEGRATTASPDTPVFQTLLSATAAVPFADQAYENMGLASTQTLGPILDGLMRNTPEARDFIERAEHDGVRSMVSERDGRFGDSSQAPPERRPDPANVIVP